MPDEASDKSTKVEDDELPSDRHNLAYADHEGQVRTQRREKVPDIQRAERNKQKRTDYADRRL